MVLGLGIVFSLMEDLLSFSFRYNGEVGDIVVGRITEVKSYQIGFCKVKVSW